jgi:hypothetical protein
MQASRCHGDAVVIITFWMQGTLKYLETTMSPEIGFHDEEENKF